MTVPYRPLVPDTERSLNAGGADDNLVIHGDNLHALKALLPRYAGRVKCIYIDPPYNTGNEGWVYNDRVNSPLMKAWLKENGPVDNEDLERHDKWLCMMWPRLHLLRELLSEDGVIFVSIDDNEQHHLRMLMDEIFGEKNFPATIIWQKIFSPKNTAKYFSQDHDFILAYARDIEIWRPNQLERSEQALRRYRNLDDDPRGLWSSSDLTARNYYSQGTYEVTSPSGAKFKPSVGNYFRVSQERFNELDRDGRIWWGSDGNNMPRLKRYISEVKAGVVPQTLWNYSDVGHTQGAKQELVSLLDFERSEDVFNTVKPSSLIKRILQIATDRDSLVLDAFAGSGTTAHAVLALNKEDGGNRKFILVECEDYADTITAERVRRVINGVPEHRDEPLREGLGGSFTYCTLGEPIDVEMMLNGEALPSYSSLAAYLLYTATGVSAGESELQPQGENGLFYSDDKTDYYMLYKPDVEYLCGNDPILNEERAKRISATGRERGRNAVMFAPAKYMGQRDLSSMGITFCQLPYELYRAR
ncbi:MAG: site-specific DNA-methyltransferase [Dehalococcoidia bacterium]|nr:site-specific DNA-methyltransferase [Dehalococcoidia bacterium]